MTSTKRITLHLAVQQAGMLRLLMKKHREEETLYVANLVKDRAREKGVTVKEGTPTWEQAVAPLVRPARIEAARLRPTLWPSLDVLMGQALTARLQQPDMAGPWGPLTRDEQVRLSLSGRWPACVSGLEFGTAERAFTLDIALVTRLRTTAWRLSEPHLIELEDRGLTGPRAELSDEQLAERDRLADLLYPSSRIAREAVEQHWPVARKEETAA